MILELLLVSNATSVCVEKFILIFLFFTALHNAATNHGLDAISAVCKIRLEATKYLCRAKYMLLRWFSFYDACGFPRPVLKVNMGWSLLAFITAYPKRLEVMNTETHKLHERVCCLRVAFGCIVGGD